MPQPIMNVLEDLARGVTAALNTAAFSLEFEAEFAWVPIATRQQLERPTVQVVPNSDETVNAAKAVKMTTAVVDVGVRRRHGGKPGEIGPIERCSEIASLAQEIANFLGDPRNAVAYGTIKATPKETRQDILRDDLIADRVFGVVVTATYNVFR